MSGPRAAWKSAAARYTLRQPLYTLASLGYGPLAPGAMVSPRIAPQLAGVGLLEAIAEADIQANAAAQAASPDPIKGHPNRAWDAVAGAERIGRFGWKANVAHQTAGAFLGDMGITSRLFPHEACTPAQTDCLAAPHGGGKRTGGVGIVAAAQASAARPEIDDATFDDVVFYQATLAPAARRRADDPQVLRGQALFAQVQCAACHRPSYVTPGAPFLGWPARSRLASASGPTPTCCCTTWGRTWLMAAPTSWPADGSGKPRRCGASA